MIDIMRLCKEIREELEGAENYAQMFQKFKDGNLAYAKKYCEMAEDELKHSEYLHSFVISRLKELRNKGVESEFLAEFWDDENRNYIDKIAKIRMILSI